MATYQELIAIGFSEQLARLTVAGSELFGLFFPADEWEDMRQGVAMALPYAPDHVLAPAMMYTGCIAAHREQMAGFAGFDPEKLEEIKADPGKFVNETIAAARAL